jgi:hypothetical protein
VNFLSSGRQDHSGSLSKPVVPRSPVTGDLGLFWTYSGAVDATHPWVVLIARVRAQH